MHGRGKHCEVVTLSPPRVTARHDPAQRWELCAQAVPPPAASHVAIIFPNFPNSTTKQLGYMGCSSLQSCIFPPCTPALHAQRYCSREGWGLTQLLERCIGKGLGDDPAQTGPVEFFHVKPFMSRT